MHLNLNLKHKNIEQGIMAQTNPQRAIPAIKPDAHSSMQLLVANCT